MTMKKGTLHLAIAAGLLALGANSAKAETPVLGPANNTLEVRVINNNASPVRVYVQDAKGRLHRMGTVASTDFKIVEIPGEITELGAVQLKLVPNEPVWSLAGDPDGVRTRDLDLKIGDAVNFWVETNLTDSKVEILKG
jgi:hypothetical protein